MMSGTRTADYVSHGHDYGAGSANSGSLSQDMDKVIDNEATFQSGITEDDSDIDKYKPKSVISNSSANAETKSIKSNRSQNSETKIGELDENKPKSVKTNKGSTIDATLDENQKNISDRRNIEANTKKSVNKFDLSKYKSNRARLPSIPTKSSIFGDFGRSKVHSTENMVKASYKLTEDVLDPDKSQEPWVNSARENKAGEVICTTHHEEPVIMHCKTCDRLVCDECITSSHKPHDLVEIRKQGLQDKLILTEKLPDVRIRAIPSLKKNLDGLSHTKAKSTEEFDNMIYQIKQRSSNLITTIEKARDRLINRCVADKDASHTFLHKLEDKLSTGLVSIESAAVTSEEALKMDKDTAIVHERIKLQWLLDKYRKSHPLLTYPKFQTGTAPREEATLEKMIGYFDGMLRCEARDQLHKIMLNVTPHGTLQPLYLKTISYMHKIRTACPGGDEQICIVPVVPTTSLDIMSSEGVSVLSQVPHTRIYDITRTMDSQFLVSDPRSRKIMRLTCNGAVVSWTNVNGIPRGLHACKNGDILLCLIDSVTFTHSKHSARYVVRLSENYKIIETYGQKEQIFNIPDRIFENVNGDICVIDRIGGLDSRLVVLDSQGEVRFEYPGEGGFDGTYGEGYVPVKRQAFSDVCCDGYANIYISDERNSEIIVLDHDGIEQKHVAAIFMMKRDKIETNIVAPHRIVIDQNGRMWVLQRRKITLFGLYN